MSAEELRRNIAAVEDPELIDRYRRGMYSDEAMPIAAAILIERGYKPEVQLPDLVGKERERISDDNIPYNPYATPAIFAIFAVLFAFTFADALFKSPAIKLLLSGLLGFAGWKLGKAIALAAQKMATPMLRTSAQVFACFVWATIMARLSHFI